MYQFGYNTTKLIYLRDTFKLAQFITKIRKSSRGLLFRCSYFCMAP